MTTGLPPEVPRQENMASYVRVSILGTSVGGEVWSVNPVFDPSFEFPGAVNQGALDTTALAIANISIPTNLRLAMSANLNRTGARLEVRDSTSDALLAISTQNSTTAQAGNGPLALPLQSAVVCSIRTDTPGGSGRGRIYWPALGVALAATGRIATPTTALLVADFKTYLLAMRSALAAGFPTIGFDIAVRSKTTHTTPHAVRLQVGDVVDTQRRRRDSLAESYVQVTVP